jgi:hypothetical protein
MKKSIIAVLLMAGAASFAAANAMPFSRSPLVPRSSVEHVRMDCDEWGRCFSLPDQALPGRDIRDEDRYSDRDLASRFRNDAVYYHPSYWDEHEHHGHHGHRGFHEHHEHGGGHHGRHGRHHGEDGDEY